MRRLTAWTPVFEADPRGFTPIDGEADELCDSSLLSTIRNADLVLLINYGEINERGTLRELLEKRGFYFRLYMSQFKGTRGDSLS